MKWILVAGVSSAVVFAALALSASSGRAQTASNSNATGSASSTAGSNSSTNNYQGLSVTSNSPADQTIKNVPNVYAPGLAAAGSEVCLGSVSAGGAGAGFGLTIGGTYVDRECQLRLNARTLATLGYPAAARETMCLDPDVRQAMLAAGTPCRADSYYAAAPAGLPGRAAVADPARSKPVAAQPTRAQPVQTQPAQAQPMQSQPMQSQLSQNDAEQSASASDESNCHKEYQLIGGWYEKCGSD